VNDWWETFFDQDYQRIWGQIFTDQFNTKQAADLWSLLHLNPGCRVLDAPCGWGRLSRQLALLGATVLGVDQSETLLTAAEAQRGELPTERLRYLRHDLRKPLPETGFDVACNIFTSFGYGTENERSEPCETHSAPAAVSLWRQTIETCCVRCSLDLPRHRCVCPTELSSSTNRISTQSPASYP